MIQSILDAISLGGLYALAALGLGLVFGVMRLVNFAHGELITIAAYMLVVTVNLPLIISLLLTVLVTAAVAFLMELTIYRRLRGVNPAIMLIASFGLSTVLQRVYELIFGALPKSAVVAPFLNGAFKFAGRSITISSVITIVLTVVILLAMGYLVEKTSLGLQLRAAAADFRTARLLGVRSNRLISAAFVLSGVLATCVAFILVVENPEVNPYYGVNITILALVGIVIGGISSLRGAALGGFVVGVILSALNTLLGNGRVYAYSWLFLLVLIILLVRPGGFLSKGSELERV
jgi:branched-chain amino acid transport system permease protein